MWNKEVGTMERGQLKAVQLKRLQELCEYVYNENEFYKNKMDEMGVKPEDIQSLDDIRRLPFTLKTDLRDHYPTGLFTAPMSKIARFHVSSGTTGKPTVVGNSLHDIEMWTECLCRSLGCAGGKAGDVLQVSYGYGLFTGGLGPHYAGENMGMTVIPTSSGNTARQIMLMEDLKTDILCCTPSYALYIGETIRDMGISLDRLKLRAGVFGAEPWTEEMRNTIEELLGIDAVDVYGLSETMGPGVAMECKEAKDGLHFWEDQFIFEILDPDTLEPVPDGEYGELVITTINRTGMPTLRYRTRDITRIIDEPCVCGRTHRRIGRLRGRSDDMLIIRGVNVFPSQIETVLASVKGVMPHYLIIADRVNNSDTLEVQVEMSPEYFSDTVRYVEGVRGEIEAKLHSLLGLSVKVRLVPPKTIERSEGKAKRVIDNRKLTD